ncbi:M48 family metallopeptidase [Candidatus Hydrogenedentota bacterium]
MTQLDMFDGIPGLSHDTYGYSVRVSNRARHVHLTMTADGGLVVVVPKRFSHKRIPAIIEKEREWIEKARRRIEKKRDFLPLSKAEPFPESASLLAVGEEWAIDYRKTESQRITTSEGEYEKLVLSGNTTDSALCRAALSRWVGRKAHEHLVPWLGKLSEVQGVHFEKTLVKGQRTLWASCSARKTISINRRLLFIPPNLVRYVFIHELAHIKHMNHSGRFWAHIEKIDPRYRDYEKELKTAWRYVPTWS